MKEYEKDKIKDILKVTEFTEEEAKKEKEFNDKLIEESEEVLNFDNLYK